MIILNVCRVYDKVLLCVGRIYEFENMYNEWLDQAGTGIPDHSSNNWPTSMLSQCLWCTGEVFFRLIDEILFQPLIQWWWGTPGDIQWQSGIFRAMSQGTDRGRGQIHSLAHKMHDSLIPGLFSWSSYLHLLDNKYFLQK